MLVRMAQALAIAACLITVSLVGCGKPKDESDVKPTAAAEASVPFDIAAWEIAGSYRWRKSHGGELELTTAGPPIGLENQARFRDAMREEILRRGGALVSADVSLAGATRVGRVIAKFPQDPSGMTYEGWLLYERAGAGHRLTVRVPEAGTTGLRDASVFNSWMGDPPNEDDPMAGWMADPYDPARKDPLMRSDADHPKWDSEFPNHPLSVLRVELAAIEASLRF